MHAGDDALFVLVDFLEHRQADARHDAHVDNDVGRIRELDADLRHRAADRAHAERQHIHRAARHAAVEEVAELLPHFVGLDPVVRRARPILRVRADERAVLDAGDVAGVAARVIAAGPVLFIQLDERAAGDQQVAQLVVFLLRTVHPVDGGGPAKLDHFLDPAQQMLVLAERFRGKAFLHRGSTVVVRGPE